MSAGKMGFAERLRCIPSAALKTDIGATAWAPPISDSLGLAQARAHRIVGPPPMPPAGRASLSALQGGQAGDHASHSTATIH